MRPLALTLALLAAIPASIPTAAQSASVPPPRQAKEQLRFTLILSRHGIRPPLTAAAALNERSSDPWPGWEVPLGHLTPHGADALAQLGAWLRADFARTGLFPPTGCLLPTDLYLYADTDERNISSTRATFNAFNPTCAPLPVHTWLTPATTLSSRPERSAVERPAGEPPQPLPDNSVLKGTGFSPSITPAGTEGALAPEGTPAPLPNRDPIFLPIAGHAFPPPPTEASLAAMRAALGNPQAALTPVGHPALNQLSQILGPAAKPILAEPIGTTANPTGDPLVTNHGPLPASSGLVEDLLLEYVNAKPLSDVGWGRLGATPEAVEANLRRLVPLHVAAFGYSHRTLFFARAEASNLLGHILDTLQQAAGTTATLSSRPERGEVERPAGEPPQPLAKKGATESTLADPYVSPEGAAGFSPSITTAGRTGALAPEGISTRAPTETRINGAFGPAGTRLVYISAHDTNLAGVAALLGLHWTADGIANDTPPDSELVFELWQKAHHPKPLKKGDTPPVYPYTVRIRYRAQTLTQLRTATALTPENRPIEIPVNPTGCRSLAKGCDLPIFLHAARATLDPTYIQLDVPPTQVAP